MELKCIPCALKCYPVRLKPGQEIRGQLLDFVQRNGLQAAFVISCVGSVTTATLRMANSTTIKDYNGHFEIVSLVGTLSADGHLHACFSDGDGHVFGGHVIGNLTVYTTAEVMIGECSGAVFCREQDDTSGYMELVVKEN